MENNRKKKLYIFTGLFVVVIILVVSVWLTVSDQNKTDIPPQSADSVTIDPITGEKVINTKGISPETTASDGIDGPDILGTSSIEPLFGDAYVFEAVKRNILSAQFQNEKYVKISPKNIVKRAVNNQQTQENYLLVEFDVYLNDNTTDKHRVSVKSQYDGLIFSTITAPNGTVSQLNTSIYGSD